MKKERVAKSKLNLKIGLFAVLILLPITSKADTIDVWNVSYNNRIIKHFNGYSKGEIVLKMDSIKPEDSLTVVYYRDTPCCDCATFLTIENEKHLVFFGNSNRGTGTPLSISIEQLLALRNKGYIRSFLVFYHEGKLERRSDKMLLFRIRVE